MRKKLSAISLLIIATLLLISLVFNVYLYNEGKKIDESISNETEDLIVQILGDISQVIEDDTYNNAEREFQFESKMEILKDIHENDSLAQYTNMLASNTLREYENFIIENDILQQKHEVRKNVAKDLRRTIDNYLKTNDTVFSFIPDDY